MSNAVLIIGSGGREHALSKAVLRSGRDINLYVYPGNVGIEKDGGIPVDASIDTWNDLADWASEKGIDLTIVGPELPLVEGVYDAFHAKGLVTFGPSQAAAEIEGSKYFSKDLMKKYGIPTADWESFTNKKDAMAYLEKVGAPIVVKVSGLAGGKGAIVCPTYEEAEAALVEIYDDNTFGDAGSRVVLEEMMYGEEASVFVVTDGEEYKILPVSQDHKRIFDNDEGPNTGGMGAYTPAPVVNDEILKTVEKDIIIPSLEAMKKEGRLYKGLLYVGIMLTETGPRVVEYNCRFGDPETEVVLPLVNCDWFDLFSKCDTGGVASVDWTIKDGFSATVVMASKGYPASSEKGQVITGIDEAETDENVDVYFAGVAKNEAGDYVTNGGRVLAVTGVGTTLQEAIDTSYKAVKKISFPGMQYRSDIGKKGLLRLNK